jgi:dipeptidyl aminopeptidase/acylaminoacyl peptidase
MQRITIDDFINYKFLSDAKFSHDGMYACFIAHEMDKKENSYNSNLWLYDLKNDKHFKLTSFGKETSFYWMKDSENIIFSELRSKDDKEKAEKGETFTKYYKINIHGGEAVEEFTIPLNVTSIEQIDENMYLVTALFDEKDRNDEKQKEEEKDYEVLDEIPFWSNGSGFINKKRSRLYLYHADSNKIEELTDKYTNVERVHFKDDKKKAVFIASNYRDKMPLTNSIFILNLQNKSIRQVVKDNEYCYSYADYIDDNKLLAAGSSMKKYGLNENHKFYSIDIDNGNMKCLTADKDFSLWDSVGSDCRYGGSENIKKDGKYVYFITTEWDSSYINRIDINGNMERVVSRNGSVDGYDVYKGNIILTAMWDMKLQEIYLLNENNIKQITYFNEWVEKERYKAALERFDVETDKGVIIEGWVMKPIDFKENKKYPAILDIHGGPKTVYGEVFFHEMQYWASKGYAVFFCNPRGSDGRGNEFSDIRGKLGTIDYDDIMKFTDAVLQKYTFIDGNSLGVTGGSYGGFMTNWIIGHTERFKAAASQRSISNWISEFGITDIGYFFADDQNGGATPWNNAEELWRSSPLRYADKVKTPTLFLHSAEDFRCSLAEGLQMFTALKYHGIESRLIMFRGENHELSRSGKPKHRIRRLKEITEWFDAHLK